MHFKGKSVIRGSHGNCLRTTFLLAGSDTSIGKPEPMPTKPEAKPEAKPEGEWPGLACELSEFW